MFKPLNFDLWRCLCKNENAPHLLHCALCGKRRWSQLGISRTIAERLMEALNGWERAA